MALGVEHNHAFVDCISYHIKTSQLKQFLLLNIFNNQIILIEWIASRPFFSFELKIKKHSIENFTW